MTAGDVMCTLARLVHRKFLRMDRFHVTVVFTFVYNLSINLKKKL